uniref:Uncharacterized protein n=1 Tax=Roseihalotalea indica TaxID=2867963 RepID=A0AA49GQI4_9BACT|nr:hypothetical protein K4G66_23860 [Tunicatimonas sp. TK19036]
MEIHLESYFLQDLMTLLDQQLDQDYLVHQPGMLKISTPNYTSRFRAMDFPHGLGCFYLDMQLEEDLDILFDIEQYHPLRFLYCLQGGFSHSGISGRLQHQVKAGQFIAYACTRGQEQRIRFPGAQTVKCVGIQIIRHEFTQHRDVSHLTPQIRSIIEDTQANQPYLFHREYAPLISSCLLGTLKNRKTGLAGHLLFEAQALQILAHQLEEYAANFLPTLDQI